MNCECKSYEAKMHLKQPLIMVLRKWRIILLFILLFSITFALYTVVCVKINSGSSNVKDLETAVAEKEKDIEYLNEAIDIENETINNMNALKTDLISRMEEASKIEINNVSDLASLASISEQIDSLNDDIAAEEEKKVSFNNEISTLEGDISILQTEISSLTELSIQRIIMQAIMGAIIGAILCFCIFFLKLVFDGRLHCREDFEDGSHLRVLGWLYGPTEPQKNIIDKIIHKIEISTQPKDDLDVAIAKIETYVGEESEIVLTGFVSDLELNTLKENISVNMKKHNINLITVDSPVNSADAIYRIEDNNVLIVCKNNETKIADINRLLDILVNERAQIVGCIII